MGLSAWKAVEDHRWALRINPSSGNLHPTEGYVICGRVPGLTEGGPSRRSVTVRPRVLSIERRDPGCVALRVLRRFSLTEHDEEGRPDPFAQYDKLRSALWLRFRSSTTFIKFGVVGASGVIVNLGAFWLLMSLGLNKYLASPIAIEVATESLPSAISCTCTGRPAVRV